VAAEGVLSAVETTPPPPSEPRPRRGPRKLVDRARTQATQTWARVEEARPRIRALDAAFDVRDYDQEVAGGLLAGAIAFRLFLWIVPFALVLVIGVGWIVDITGLTQEELADRWGIAGLVARYVGQASRQSSTSRVLLLLIGLYALYLASMSAVRALRVAHLLAWRMPPTRFKAPFTAALGFTGGILAISLVMGGINALRDALPGPGLVLLILMVVVFFAAWLWASWLLPHPPEVSPRALVPGALFVAAGAQVLHLITVLWYANKIEHSSELYGGLGVAVGFLAWLYLLGRLTIASAVLNATLWRRSLGASAMPHEPADG
jgi:uncharacterized BrkB/YihY/UPF0761 family membrane protein